VIYLKIVFCAIGPETSKGVLMYGGTRFWIEMGKRWGKKKENEIHVVGSVGTYDTCIREGIKARFYLVPFEFILPFLGVIVRMIKACCLNFKTFNGMIFSPSHFLWDTLPAFCLKKRVTKLTWVATVHHVIPPPTERRGNFLRNLLSFVSQKLSFALIKDADAIVTLSNFVKECLVTLGFDGDRILVMSNGVPYDGLSKVQGDEKESYDAIFMGRLHPAKGVFDLIKIWKRVVKSNKDAKLALIGSGSREVAKKLERAVIENGLQRNFDVLGYLPDDEAYRIIKSAKLFIFPSYEEGWGISVCEAMALGIPVILYDLPAYRDFQDAVVRVTVGDVEAFAQAVLKLMSNEKARAEMAGKAQEIASRFDLDKIAEQNWSILTKVSNPRVQL